MPTRNFTLGDSEKPFVTEAVAVAITDMSWGIMFNYLWWTKTSNEELYPIPILTIDWGRCLIDRSRLVHLRGSVGRSWCGQRKTHRLLGRLWPRLGIGRGSVALSGVLPRCLRLNVAHGQHLGGRAGGQWRHLSLGGWAG